MEISSEPVNPGHMASLEQLADNYGRAYRHKSPCQQARYKGTSYSSGNAWTYLATYGHTQCHRHKLQVTLSKCSDHYVTHQGCYGRENQSEN